MLLIMTLDSHDMILVLGSCFAANIGSMLLEKGFDVSLNPFGTIFNPVSIRNSLLRLESGTPFTEDECVEMGAGAGLWGSFSHYTRHARPTREEFLTDANSRLAADHEFFARCNKVIITFGTAWCFWHGDMVVSNCLKRPAREFERKLLDVQSIVDMYSDMLQGPLKNKEVIFTISPIRHLADGAHGNQVSKAVLLLAVESLCNGFDNCHYFPSYEIMLDELRDYRWYAEDKVHPNEEAIALIQDRFCKEMSI